MRTMTEDRFQIVRAARPDAEVKIINGQECVVLCEYDIDNDKVTEHVFKLVRRHTSVIPVQEAGMRPVRSGRIADWGKWFKDTIYQRPDGQTFKIVDPPKPDKDDELK